MRARRKRWRTARCPECGSPLDDRGFRLCMACHGKDLLGKRNRSELRLGYAEERAEASAQTEEVAG